VGIFLVRIQMRSQLGDAFGQQRDLNFGGPGISGVTLVPIHNLSLSRFR